MIDRTVFGKDWHERKTPRHRRACLSWVLVSGGAVDAQDPEPLREGTCELAGELFPDTNPGPGSLKEIRYSRTHEPRDIRAQPERGHRARQGAVLGHAGRQRRRAGVRVVPFPRRRRPALHQPGQPGRRRQP